ncbi:MAG: TetR/AcrR family transcriptional regulator [Nitrospina sp.]|jgi:AcrR family transcriptional regulator|nr:TetR/AcrR family transcriptional regulator [Nitrospina sp.]
MAKSSKREQLLQAALGLFCKKGYHGVGVDSISAKAGITKKTLYHHFKSKDEMILAALRHYEERSRNDFMRAVEAKTESPADRLLAVFDVLEEWFREDEFSGCLFVGAMGEYPEEGTPIRRFCQEAKGLTRGYIKTLIEKAELQGADELSEQLMLLIEGAITMAQVNNSSLSAVRAKNAAKVLIQNSTSHIEAVTT